MIPWANDSHVVFVLVPQYGCPQAIVSDNGSVFRAGDYLAILRALEIEPLHIEQGKPWQGVFEQRRQTWG